MGRKTKLDVRRVYELYELYANDESISIADIANMEGISVIYVKKLFSRISKCGNLTTKSPEGIFKTPASENLDVFKEVKELRELGFTYEQIGDHLNLSKGWVHKIANRDNGVLNNV